MLLHFRITADGSHTLYVPELDEHYHSMNGAVSESMLVFIKNGFRYFNPEHTIVFEMGFGTGLNVLLTWIEAERDGRSVTCHSIERYPLPQDTVDRLNYPAILGGDSGQMMERIHSAPWNRTVALSPLFSLKKIEGDIHHFEAEEMYHVVYFDAFAPGKQPDVWTGEIFRKIYRMMVPGGVLTTYSSKSMVRHRLAEAGFVTETLPGPKGKREVTRAIKPGFEDYFKS